MYEPRVYHADPQMLITLAREILRRLDTSVEQKILESLKRIEARLPETE